MGGFRKRPIARLSRQVRFINKRLSSEVKKFDTNVVDATLDIGGTIFGLSNIPQGDTVSNREGNQVRPKYIAARGTITLPSDAVYIRLILVQDTQMTPATAPTNAQILQTTVIEGLMNIVSAGAGRFNILMDRTYRTETDGSTQPFKFYKRLDRAPIRKMTWTSGTATDFQNGHFFLLAITNLDESGAIDLNFRLGFYDN